MSLLTPDLGARWRTMRFNPIRTVSPQMLAAALDEFEAGHLRRAALLWEVIEDRDDVLKLVGPKRRKAVSRRPWTILKTDDSDEAEAQAEALRFFYNNLTATDALDGNVRGGFSTLVRQMMDAAFKKYAQHEIVWQPRGRFLTAELKFVPLYFFENRTGRLRWIGPEGGVNGTALDEGGWMTTVGDGLMTAASICYIFKKLSLQDWLNFSEKFGMPGIHGETPAQKGTPEWNAFVEALASFANDWVTASAAGTKINLIEAKQNGDGPFQPMVDRMDRRMAALCRGADLGTISSQDGTGASLQDEEGDILIEDDCAMVTETLNTYIDRPVLRWIFGEEVEPLAYVHIPPPVRQDVKQELEVDAFLLASGGELDAAETYERYSRAVPKDLPEGATLKKPAAAPAPVPAGSTPGGNAPSEQAPNDASSQVAEAIGVPAGWLAPAAQVFDELAATARGEGSALQASAVVAALERAADQVPELFASMDVADFADVLSAALGSAALEGARAALAEQSTKTPASK